LCSGKSSIGDRRMPVSDSVVDVVWGLCAAKSAPVGDEGTEYTDMVVIMGEPGAVWHSTAGGVAILRQHKSRLYRTDLQAAGLGAYKKLSDALCLFIHRSIFCRSTSLPRTSNTSPRL
jgi:hypothetical protein